MAGRVSRSRHEARRCRLSGRPLGLSSYVICPSSSSGSGIVLDHFDRVVTTSNAPVDASSASRSRIGMPRRAFASPAIQPSSNLTMSIPVAAVAHEPATPTAEIEPLHPLQIRHNASTAAECLPFVVADRRFRSGQLEYRGPSTDCPRATALSNTPRIDARVVGQRIGNERIATRQAVAWLRIHNRHDAHSFWFLRGGYSHKRRQARSRHGRASSTHSFEAKTLCSLSQVLNTRPGVQPKARILRVSRKR